MHILICLCFVFFIIDYLKTLDKWPSYPQILFASEYGAVPGRDCTIALQECFDI